MIIISGRKFRDSQSEYFRKALEEEVILTTLHFGNFRLVPISEGEKLISTEDPSVKISKAVTRKEATKKEAIKNNPIIETKENTADSYVQSGESMLLFPTEEPVHIQNSVVETVEPVINESISSNNTSDEINKDINIETIEQSKPTAHEEMVIEKETAVEPEPILEPGPIQEPIHEDIQETIPETEPESIQEPILESITEAGPISVPKNTKNMIVEPGYEVDETVSRYEPDVVNPHIVKYRDLGSGRPGVLIQPKETASINTESKKVETTNNKQITPKLSTPIKEPNVYVDPALYDAFPEEFAEELKKEKQEIEKLRRGGLRRFFSFGKK